MENFQTKKANGISLWFLAVWFFGDVTNLVGALWAGLVPTVIALAVYFCIADTVLIVQCLYYKNIKDPKDSIGETPRSGTDDANEPLLRRANENGQSHPCTCRSSTPNSQHSCDDGPVTHRLAPGDQKGAPTWVKNSVAVLAVCAIGTTGWVIAWKTGIWKPVVGGNEKPDLVRNNIGASILGYISAICYLG